MDSIKLKTKYWNFNEDAVGEEFVLEEAVDL
jgi:hypothetical protein